MKKLGYFITLGVLILLSSCRKETDEIPISGKLNSIQVSPTFNWSTSKTIDVNITGLPTEIPVISTLIISLEDGSSLYQGSHAMNQTKVIQITVPVIADKIKLKYGSVEYILTIETDKVDFSFIPKIVD